MLRLSERLQAVYDFVIDGNIVADIGTDHGYLPIALVQGGKSPFAYACDLREGPLSRARENIMNAGLGEKIETLLSDGLTGLSSGMVDTITITGMGGRLIQNILTAKKSVYSEKTQLILSPQSEIGEFRRFLCEEGFETIRERMVNEDGKYYVIMDCRFTGLPGSEHLTKEQLEFGGYLLDTKDSVLYEYLCREKKVCDSILKKIEQNVSGESARNRKQALIDELMVIEDALNYY